MYLHTTIIIVVIGTIVVMVAANKFPQRWTAASITGPAIARATTNVALDDI